MSLSQGFGAVGKGLVIHEPCNFVRKEAIFIGDHVAFSEFSFFHAGAGFHLGSFIHIATHCSLVGGGLCILEDFVGISAGVRLVTGSEMLGGEGLTNPMVPEGLRAVSRKWVHLGRHAFLATDVVVLPGVTIGEGAVVAAKGVVNKDLEPWTVYAGNPVRAVGKRESGRIRELEARAYAASGTKPFDPGPLLALKKATETRPHG